jgi:hypothetical protein
MTLQDFLLLGLSIRPVRRSRAVVASSRSCRLFHDDRITGERGEELTPGFSVAERQLPVCLKMSDDRQL